MVQYEVTACSASVKGLLHKPRAPITFCLLRSRSCNKEHNNDDLFARVLPRYVGKPNKNIRLGAAAAFSHGGKRVQKAWTTMTVSTKKCISIHVSKRLLSSVLLPKLR